MMAQDSGAITPAELQSFRQSHDEHLRALDALRSALTAADIFFDEILRDDLIGVKLVCTHVIAVGGDGTVLSVAHKIRNDVPIIGVRSSDSSVGHLCAYGHLEMASLVKDLLANTFRTITVQRMQTRIKRLDGSTDESHPILNEVLFSHGHPAGTSRYLIRWGDQKEMQRSSGIWVATPMGSTGAMSAAGGRRYGESERQFQFYVRELFHPPNGRLSISCATFDPDRDLFSIENRSDNCLVAFDGLHGSMAVGFGDIMTIVRAKPLLLARPQSDKLVGCQA